MNSLRTKPKVYKGKRFKDTQQIFFEPRIDKLKSPDKVEIRKSNNHGYGVFAREDIKKGEIIEECFIIDVNGIGQHAHTFQYEKHAWPPGGTRQVIPTGFGVVYNTALKPEDMNATWVTTHNLIVFVAVKPIKKGEELLQWYVSSAAMHTPDDVPYYKLTEEEDKLLHEYDREAVTIVFNKFGGPEDTWDKQLKPDPKVLAKIQKHNQKSLEENNVLYSEGRISSTNYTAFLDSNLKFDNDRIVVDDVNSELNGIEVMMSWEKPIMKESANYVTKNGGDILEFGFGMGISADYIQKNDILSHTIIEPHPQVLKKLYKWAKDKPNVKIIPKPWYQAYKDGDLDTYDGIFYDTFGDEHSDLFARSLKDLVKKGTLLTFWNTEPLVGGNIHDIPCDYVEIQVKPDENNYHWNSDKYSEYLDKEPELIRLKQQEAVENGYITYWMPTKEFK